MARKTLYHNLKPTCFKECGIIVNGYNSPMYQSAMDYYNNGICNNSIEQAAMDECLAVVIPIYSGAEADITGGALYFHSYPNPDDWAYHNSYTQVYVSGTEKFWFYK